MRRLKKGVSKAKKQHYLEVITKIYELTKHQRIEVTTEKKKELCNGIAVTVFIILVQQGYLHKIGRNLYFWVSPLKPSEDIATECILQLRKRNRRYAEKRRQEDEIRKKEDAKNLPNDLDITESPPLELEEPSFKQPSKVSDMKMNPEEEPLRFDPPTETPETDGSKKRIEEKKSILWGLYSYSRVTHK